MSPSLASASRLKYSTYNTVPGLPSALFTISACGHRAYSQPAFRFTNSPALCFNSLARLSSFSTYLPLPTLSHLTSSTSLALYTTRRSPTFATPAVTRHVYPPLLFTTTFPSQSFHPLHIYSPSPLSQNLSSPYSSYRLIIPRSPKDSLRVKGPSFHYHSTSAGLFVFAFFVLTFIIISAQSSSSTSPILTKGSNILSPNMNSSSSIANFPPPPPPVDSPQHTTPPLTYTSNDIQLTENPALKSTSPATDEDMVAIFGPPEKIAPGHPGNLTEEQVRKLQELWILAAKAFGVMESKTLDLASNLMVSINPAASSLQPDNPKSPKSPSASGGFWRRKKSTDPDSSSSTTRATLDESDDKHGFKKAYDAAMSNWSGEEMRTAFWEMVKHDHPDAILLRFLRARKWDVQAAFVMAVAALHWRLLEGRVDSDITKNGEEWALKMASSESTEPLKKKECEDFLDQLRMGKSIIIGRDVQSRPVSLVRARLHKIGQHCESSLERYTIYSIETTRMMLSPPIDTATLLFDMSGFGLSNMDYTPLKFMIRCFEANYPESLGVIIVHRAPWIFQGVWSIIKGLLDPVVVTKINFTKSAEELSQFLPPETITQELGGDREYEWKYIEPEVGENKLMDDASGLDKLKSERAKIVAKFEEATIEWLMKSILKDRDDTPAVTHAVADEASRRRHSIAAQLRNSYWKMDPYVRARTVYDRLGYIEPNEVSLADQ